MVIGEPEMARDVIERTLAGLDPETRSERLQAIESRADDAHRRLLVDFFNNR